MKWINTWNTRRIRRKGGRIMGMDALVLTTIGRKSGTERSTPVAWFPDSDHSWLIVASANGAAHNPAWYYNLAAHPDRARIDVGGRTIPVSAEQLHGQARDRAWRQITAAKKQFAKYEKQTDRDIPVIRLTARPS
ncbi:nitroreductase [Mycobacterium kansasii]|nr:nitroreductase [Mycobacterium kansasii]